MVKAFHHICIQTGVYQESLHFYCDLLGFKVVKVNENFNSRDYNTWLELHNIKIELQTPKKGTIFLDWSNLNSGPVHMAVVVNNIQEAYQSLANSGQTNFKHKNGEIIYRVNENTEIFKVIAPEGTEIEFRDNPKLD